MVVRPTLQAALDRGAVGLTVYCIKCSTSRRFTAAQAAANWPGHLTFAEIAAKSRHRCGRKASQAAPEWPRRDNPGGPPMDAVPWDWPK